MNDPTLRLDRVRSDYAKVRDEFEGTEAEKILVATLTNWAIEGCNVMETLFSPEHAHSVNPVVAHTFVEVHKVVAKSVEAIKRQDEIIQTAQMMAALRQIFDA